MPKIAGETLKVVAAIPEERVSEHTVTQRVDVHVPNVAEEILEVVKVILTKRSSKRIMAQTDDPTVPQVADKILAVAKAIPWKGVPSASWRSMPSCPCKADIDSLGGQGHSPRAYFRALREADCCGSREESKALRLSLVSELRQ